ncbi:partial Transcription-repair-coupling factor, partial [biofilm metagenome]
MTKNFILSPEIPQEKQQDLKWTGLPGCGDSLRLASAIQQENRLFVVIAPDSQAALRLEHELAFFLGQQHPILHFPDWETLPYDVFSPLPEITSERLLTLAVLQHVKRGVLIVAAPTLMHRLAPREHILAHSFAIRINDKFDPELNRLKLENVGYQCVSQVYQHGEFAVRGSIVDLFPMGSKEPFRIELFDDEVDTIRTFDPESQRSLIKCDAIELFPAREFPFTDEAIKQFRQAFRDAFPEASPKNLLYVDVSKAIAPGGIEYYLPLFVDRTECLFDYLPESAMLVTSDRLDDITHAFYAEAQERYGQRKYDVNRPLLPPERLFLQPHEFAEKLTCFAKIMLALPEVNQTDNTVRRHCLPELTIDTKLAQPALRLLSFISEFPGKILFVAESAGRREALIDKLRLHKITVNPVDNWHAFITGDSSPAMTVAQLDHGLILENPALAIITESQLSGEKIHQRRRRRKSSAKELENIINNLNELTIGAPVVHQEHGVGRYLGLITLKVGGIDAEFLALEYANQDKLYVPVSSLNVIGRYTGMSPENAPLHKLGSDQWAKAKKKAIARIRDVAAELLEIQAKRAVQTGHAFSVQNEDYLKFADAFPFEETPDQQTAIEAILEDMAKAQPMDRVVCGDVGFGKTEVAMRAAFIAVQSGKQVAVLVPTTLLAQQHYQNFSDRFADWPVRVEVMSRFVSPKQQKEILGRLEEGKVDIVLGTH